MSTKTNRLERFAFAALDHHVADDARHLELGHARLELLLRIGPYLAVEKFRSTKFLDLLRSFDRTQFLHLDIHIDEFRLGRRLLQLEEARVRHCRLVADIRSFQLETLQVGDLQLRRDAMDHRHVPEVCVKPYVGSVAARFDDKRRIIAVHSRQRADIRLIVHDSRIKLHRLHALYKCVKAVLVEVC